MKQIKKSSLLILITLLITSCEVDERTGTGFIVGLITMLCSVIYNWLKSKINKNEEN